MPPPSGFIPCTLDDSAGPVVPKWEKSVVLTALAIHVADVGLDILVLLLFFFNMQWGFLVASGAVVLGAWIVAGLYISFGSGAAGPTSAGSSNSNLCSSGAGDECEGRRLADITMSMRFMGFTQIQIFSEAYRCIVQGEETDYFHTLRLLEALLESAPNALVHLYAMVLWAGKATAPSYAVSLLRASVLSSILSVGIGLAMWEQKVQFRASCGYVVSVSILRCFEVASRTLTLALFAGLTHPYGLIWVLVVDYVVMVLMIAKHRSVDFSYGFFVAIPLLLVSLEPFVWRRQDHAVPKDSYFAVRVIESILMWAVITKEQGRIDSQMETYPIWIGSEFLALMSTLGLYCFLPFVWKAARRQELSREVEDWGDETGDDEYSGSDRSDHSGGPEEGRSLMKNVDGCNVSAELPAE